MTEFDPAKAFSPGTLWCGRHLEPFRDAWPVGYLAASMALFEESVRLEQIMRACGWDPEKGSVANAELLHGAIIEHGPLCCLLGDEITAKWTRLALADDLEPLRAELERLRAVQAP